MDTFWTAAGEWWVRAVLSGGAVLLVGWLAVLVCRRPAGRQRAGAWAVRGAVLAVGLSVLPNWLLLPRPGWATPPAPVVETCAPPAPAAPIADVTPEPKESPTPRPSPDVAPASVVETPAEEPMAWTFVPRERLRFDPLPTTESEPSNVTARSAGGPEGCTDTPVSPASVVPLLLSVYFVVAGVLLLQLVWERLALAWLLRDAIPLTGRARWVWDRLTIDEPAYRAVSSARVRSPICVGFFRPLVVLPKRLADSADDTALRWVMAHELDHLRRGDTRTAHWVGVARAVFFFLPWFWLLRRDLGLSQEYLADAAAADMGANPADYAAFLVDLSAGRNSRRPLAAARMKAGKSDLFRRVHMLLNVKSAARGVTRGFTWLAGTAAVAAAVGLSGLGFADEPKKEDPKVERKVEELAKPVVLNLDLDVEFAELLKPLLLDTGNQDALKPVVGQVRLPDDEVKARKVKEELIQLLKDGKVDEAKKLVKQLEKVEVVRPAREALAERREVVRPMRLQPPAADVPVAPRVVVGVENDLRAQYDRQMKEFEEAIKKAKDAEAKEQLEKARDEYKKAMEEPLKKADEARKDLDAARKKMEQAERANRGANDEALRRLIEMQKQMEKRLLEDAKRFEGLDGLGRLDGNLFGGQLGGGFVVGPDGRLTPLGRNAGQPRLGVQIEKVSAVLAEQLDLPKDSGIVIADVTAGGAAEKAGMKKNDVLLKLADKDVPTDPTAFVEMVGKLKAGEKIDAVVLRKGKKETVKGIELPEPKQPGRGGLPGGRLGGGAAVGGNEQVQIQINNDEVSLQGTVDGVGYTITGAAQDGKLVPAKIVIKEGRESKEYDSLEKVPAGQRETVERLIGKVRLVGGK